MNRSCDVVPKYSSDDAFRTWTVTRDAVSSEVLLTRQRSWDTFKFPQLITAMTFDKATLQ